jgi:ribonuclease HII
MEKAENVGVGLVSSKQIDRTNILAATHKAMKMALGKLHPTPQLALIDGRPLRTNVIQNKGIVGGDGKIESIMAASIVAKVTRDKIMEQYDIVFPDYGFAKHKGYGTKLHMEALILHKACPIHRKSFAPVKANMPTMNWLKNEKKIGRLGEQLTALRLMKDGFRILEMNRTCGNHGELDIIARKNDLLVIVEVKSATKEQMGDLSLKVDHQKKQKLQNAIQHYLQKDEPKFKDIRLDVSTVLFMKGKPKIEFFRGVD